MPERGFASETWNADSWFQDLESDQKLLFIYLWTNDHCNQAGLYYITLSTIAFDTKLPKEKLPGLLNSLSPKVIWRQEVDLVWVKNFVKRQSKSPKFLQAVAICLTHINNNGAVKELLLYNQEKYSISIPYQYYMDRLPVPYRYLTATGTDTSTDPVTNKDKGGSRGEKELGVISTLYEENIGILTPVVAEQLKFIADSYPLGWFKEALDEAIRAGVRKISYIEAILERWQTDGFKTPKHRGKKPFGVIPTEAELAEAERKE